MTSRAARIITDDPMVLDVWARLTRRFAIWRLIVIASLSRRAMLPATNNNIGVMLDTDHWKTGLGVLGGLDDDQLDLIAAMATINARRVEHVFRTSTLMLVTVPVGVFIGLHELAPQALESIGFTTLSASLSVLGIWGFFAALMMAASWRAKDVLDVISYEQARRSFDRARQR
ncbi:MAG: hypothetical protein P8J78_02145 [Maricaulis sp.]|jgi:hypothetical protein|nr:hypothetical protein [Maricaulis sp.]MDG2043385.1 hypothetical protein [Maricaulis sp.]